MWGQNTTISVGLIQSNQVKTWKSQNFPLFHQISQNPTGMVGFISLLYAKLPKSLKQVENVQIWRLFHSELQAMSHQMPRCRNIRRVSFSTYFWIFCAFSQLSWLFAKAFSQRAVSKRAIRSKERKSSNRTVRHLVIF